METVEKVTNFFLEKEAMSPKKLQKLLYYAYAWTIALLNEDEGHLENRLFGEHFEAWIHGPVLPGVYVKYKEYGWNDIPQVKNEMACNFAPDVKDVLEQVWNVYGGMNGNQLEAISHKEVPWLRARAGIPAYEAGHKEISDIDIFQFYNSQATQ